MFDMVKIGRKIAFCRKKKNMTQMALADALGISFQAVSNWERGESMPDISKLGELSQILDVSIDELLGNERQATLVEKVIEERPISDATPEELAELAPIMEPEQINRTVKGMDESADKTGEQNRRAYNMEELKPLLPFMSEEDIAEMARAAIASGARLTDIAVLAPHMDEEDIGDITREYLKKGAKSYGRVYL